MKKKFIGTCVTLSGYWLDKMDDHGKEITRKTFLKYADSEDLKELASDLGYADHPKRGLTMAQEGYITYYKSVYHGSHVCILVGRQSGMCLYNERVIRNDL